ncbi:MAG: hypothetical protein Q4D23_02195, partial [Bacteroidales bacterium]|nr:hypothetical protein [Bacteroidales bacterium]
YFFESVIYFFAGICYVAKVFCTFSAKDRMLFKERTCHKTRKSTEINIFFAPVCHKRPDSTL